MKFYNPVAEMLRYLDVYKKYLGYKIYIVFFLTFVAVILDSVGIVLFLPALQVIMSGGDGLGMPFADVQALSFLQPIIEKWLSRLAGILDLSNSASVIFLAIVFIFFVKAVIVFAATAFNSYLRARFLWQVKKALLESTRSLSFEYVSNLKAGHFVNIINEQAFRAMQCLYNLTQAFIQLLSTILYVSLAAFISFDFAVITLLVGLLVFVLYLGLNNITQTLSQRIVSEKSLFVSRLLELFQNFSYLRVTNLRDMFQARVVALVMNIARTQTRLGIASAASKSSQEFVIILVIMSVILFYTFINPEQLPQLLLSIMLLYRAVASILAYQVSWQTTLETIGSISEIESELARFNRNVRAASIKAVGKHNDAGALVKLTNVEYTVSGQRILESVSLDVNRNRTLALVGKSGAGKTTLANIIAGLIYPTSGNISYLAECLSAEEEMGGGLKIGFITQDSVIFDGSILYNLTMSDASFEDLSLKQREKIETILESVNLLEIVRGLSNGIDTNIGERGVKLSGGQRQRLFLAREMLRDNDLLILDEATSALDIQTEVSVKEALDKLAGTLTVVVIAHRTETIKNCDDLVLLEAGRIIGRGSFSSMSARFPEYFES